MKSRSGFVSNSSSSSFIIGLPKVPETEEDLAEMLGDCAPLVAYGLHYTTKEAVVTRVFRDLQHSKPINRKDGLGIPFDAEVWEDVDFYAHHFQYAHGGEQRTFEDALEEFKRSLLKSVMEKSKGFDEDLVLYELSYADDGGESNLEHGSIFRNIPHQQESHH
jgi:hypothetical protein